MKSSESEQLHEMMTKINRTWQKGEPDQLMPYLHPDIVMAFPGFAGRAEGADAIIAGFREFCNSSVLHECNESDYDIEVFDSAAVVSFRFDLTYERSQQKFRSTGRDIWIFQKHESLWKAIWRTMIDMNDEKLGE
jgi:hypothetical protein